MQKIALIGNSHASAIVESDKVELTAIVEKNEELGKNAAEEYGCKWYAGAEEMLKNEDVDICDICLPTFLHEEYVCLAAKYKKNVLCEKPVALNVESFDRMVAACKEAGVKFMVAQVVRFWNEYADIKSRYDNGDFGKIKLVCARRLAQHPNWTNWQRNPELSGGGLYDLHNHDIDFLRYAFGEPESIYAVGYKNDTGCWNHIATTIRFKNGVAATAEGAYEMTEGFPFTMHFCINGTDRSASYDFKAGLNIKDGDTFEQEVIYEAEKEPLIIPKTELDAYQAEIEYFAECVEKGVDPEKVPLYESRQVLQMLEAIRYSLETGEIVKF